MEFLREELFRKINNEHSPKCPCYLRSAKERIDKAVDDAEINDSFYKEYYHLKRDIEFRNLCYPSVPLAILTGVAVTYAIEAEKQIGWIGYLGILITCAVVAMVISFHSITKQSCVLEPYLLEKMEKKILLGANQKDENA